MRKASLPRPIPNHQECWIIRITPSQTFILNELDEWVRVAVMESNRSCMAGEW
ncbi:hypothetical protein D3C86_1393810 [compost metagenome]